MTPQTTKARTYVPKTDLPIDVLVGDKKEHFMNVLLGKTYIEDLPNVGEYVTIKSHHGDTKYMATAEVLNVDETGTGRVWLEVHWTGWANT
jgi:hypothetical protein